MEYIRRKDAIRSVLRNDGEATVAAIQELPKIDLNEIRDELIQRLCQHCDTTPEEKLKDGCCEGCPIIAEIKAVFAGK